MKENHGDIAMNKFWVFFLILMAALSLPRPAAAETVGAGPRYALVIGNGSYAELGKLKNPPNDAEDMAATLRELDFDVELLIDADLPKMEDAVIRLGGNLSRQADSVGFFFFAGHGAQSGGTNYLIPADARIASESFLKTKALATQAVLDTLQDARNALNVVVLDACRDNPFSWSRSGSRGLTVVGNQPPGSIVAYATSVGSVAQDGDGRNGVFTRELLAQLRLPGLEITEVFKRTGAAVQEATRSRQVPAMYSQFFGNAYLAGAAPAAPESGGLHVERVSDDAIRGEVYVKGGPFRVGPEAWGKDEKSSRGAPIAGGVFQIVGDVFKMVGGILGVGSRSEAGDEDTTQEVQVSDFRMMRTEVTRKDYRELMGTQTSDSEDDELPVVDVSWYEAVAYANKLSAKDGLERVYTIDRENVRCDWEASGWRLPTEAEWEYAARGGNHSRNYKYAGSNSIDSVAWYDETTLDHGPVAVGTKAPNELGLYDMSGNAWEWCWDREGSYAAESPIDPRGSGTDADRVIRGGSWDSGASHSLLTGRKAESPDEHEDDLGFRLVRRAGR
jgi:formylglycine-generating enzyme required for sulfatase activity